MTLASGKFVRASARLLCAILALSLLAGCPFSGRSGKPSGTRVKFLQLSSVSDTTLTQDSHATVAARNETIGFAVNVTVEKLTDKLALRVRRPRIGITDASIDVSQYTVYQILPVPVNLNRAAFVRHTAMPAGPRAIGRALLPVKLDAGTIKLSSLRNAGTSFDLWIDLKIPANASPGVYQSAVDVFDARSNDLISSAGLSVEVFSFTLPQQRNLHMVSRLDWHDLTRIWPERFEAITPRLMNRTDARYTPAVRTLDQLISLAQSHRLNVVVPRLQPTVKWPGGTSPSADWKDFDGLVGPWLTGTAFSDRAPLGYWPLPEPDYLNNFDPASRAAYWRAAATHFDQNEWLEKTSIFVNPPAPGRLNSGEPILMSADIAVMLRSHPRLRVTAPLAFDQIVLADPNTPNLIPSELADRLQAAGAPLVSSAPTRTWPSDLPRPSAWLRTDMPGLTPHIGIASAESDVRLWAFLANLRSAQMVMWPSPFPSAKPDTLASEDEFAWFYPGEWFGTTGVLPSLQLKWLRRAQQDFEYCWLMRKNKAEEINSMVLSRLVCKPVELSPTQPPDATYALMTGSSNPTVWTELQKLIAKSIELYDAQGKPDTSKQNALKLQTMRWRDFQDRPLLVGRSADWFWDTLTNRPTGNFIDVRVGIDLYNPAADSPAVNLLQWTALTSGWQVRPQPQSAPALGQFKVRRMNLDGRFDLDRLQPGSRQPIEITFTNGYTGRTSPIRLMLPIAASYRREASIVMDGSLADWDSDDCLQDGPLVQMLSQPMVNEQALKFASTPTQVYSNFSDEHFYLAFKADGFQTQSRQTRNFVNYDLRRVWGEDLCQVLIQPIYIDNSLGPVLHLVLKTGGPWIERRKDPRSNVEPWQPVEGAAVRYASWPDGATLRGELAIPWKVIADPSRGRPALLRFNFIQHKSASGESASWAGPIDFGRDDAFMGLLHLREPNTPGMR